MLGKRLIDADKIMDELRDYADRKCANGYMDTANGILSAVNYIRNNVSRVDAVEVVRCLDCIYYHRKIGYGFGQCGKCSLMPYPEDFCSYGERKYGDGNG